MVTISQRGQNPEEFNRERRRAVLVEVNRTATELLRELSAATPVGVAGRLRQGWQLELGSQSDPTATIAQSSPYFLAVELGRKPGKGISQQGQAEVAIWAQRVLGMQRREARGFAYLLSQKYKKRGRKARGFAGLAQPDSPAREVNLENIPPVPGGLIGEAFEELDRRLGSLAA